MRSVDRNLDWDYWRADMYYPRAYPYTKKRVLIPTVKQAKRTKNGSKRGFYTGEVKFVDAELGGTAITNAWVTLNPTTLDTLSAIAQGTTESTHNGRTCYLRSVHLKGQVSVAAAEAVGIPASDRIFRLALVLNTDTKGAELVATNVYDAGQSNDVFAFRNLQHTSVIKVLWNKTYVMFPRNLNEGAVDSFAKGATRRVFEVNHTFKKPLRVLFSGTTAVVGSIVDNSLHFCACALVTSPTMLLDYQVRVRFTETAD